MKILEFAFDSRDSTGRWEYMPYNYVRNCAVYTGTHDNEALTGWLDSILPEEVAEVREFFGVPDGTKQETVQAMIRAAFASTANLCIIPLQDYLGLDNRARINQPSTFGKNWKWRARKEQLDTELQERIRRLTELYGRTRL
jgi:4-alpha-glucanotransferase